MTKNYTVILIEDEVRVRRGLKSLIADIPNLEVIAESGSIVEAKTIIENKQPDIVLLDINLEDGTGFDLLESLNYNDFALVFITAYDEYAIKGFKYNALDYLLKPIDPFEFEKAIKKSVENRIIFSQIRQQNEPTQIIIKTNEGRYIIPFNDLIRCEADEGYTKFYLASGKKYMVAKPLKYYDNLLPSSMFLRVHQSHLINKDFVQNYCATKICMKATTIEIPISTRKKASVFKVLEG